MSNETQQRRAGWPGAGGNGVKLSDNFYSITSTPPSQAPIPIYACGKIVGEVRGDTFHKSVSSSRHFLRKPPAICLDVQSLRDARAAGAAWVEIHDRDTGRVYRASIDQIVKRGFTVNRGFGEQIGLPLALWSVSNGNEPAARQLALALGD